MERGLEDILLYVGGNLVVGKTPFAEVEKKFRAMGYDRVFAPDTELPTVAALLRQDLQSRAAARTAPTCVNGAPSGEPPATGPA